MLKDFDGWNNRKKIIHSQGENKFYRSREVWWCSLGINIGFEQDGANADHQRPVLIIRGFSKNVCLVIPLTSSIKKNPYHFFLGNVDGRDAFGIVSQIRLIDTKRLVNRVAIIDKKLFEEIKKVVRNLI